ncbi:MAG TPA: bifunctional phosphoglucose/phosphomannose isomerase [Patescibacteria group bacterium]|nr:bifunctional phosphoglucose/phosphomannose isomerase [Patescibacteria group bacterium]
MLDDLKMIHDRDAQDALGIAQKQWQQLKTVYDVNLPDDFTDADIGNVVLGGMGGSALAAEIATAWPGIKKPFEIVKGYDLPEYVSGKTLFVASSYSGNTEETLSALEEAESRGAKIVVICAGGKLTKKAEENNYPLYKIPNGFQPRMAVFYNLAAVVQLFESASLSGKGKIAELKETADWLGDKGKELLADVPANSNIAKKIAQELVGNSIVIYSGPKLFPAAYKWKINFNENAKNIAWCNYLPEFNHNEFLGWTSHPVEKPYKIVDIRSSLEHPRIQTRFEISEKLLSGKRPYPETIIPEGDTLLKQLLWTIQLGDFVSLYLAILNGLNPTPVELIEKLKAELQTIQD